MDNSFDSLDQAFDITVTPEEAPKPVKKVKPIIEVDKGRRSGKKIMPMLAAQLYNIVEKMQEGI